MNIINVIRWLSLVIVVILTFNKRFWPVTRDFDSSTSWLFFLLLSMALPLLFKLTKRNKIDAFLGHLSYPVYIGHMFVISMVYNLAKETTDRGAITVLISLGLAVVLYFLIDRPVNRYRSYISSLDETQKQDTQPTIKDARQPSGVL